MSHAPTTYRERVPRKVEAMRFDGSDESADAIVAEFQYNLRKSVGFQTLFLVLQGDLYIPPGWYVVRNPGGLVEGWSAEAFEACFEAAP